MGASQVPATTGSDNWVQISSVTPTASVSTLSFSSISGYKKLMLRIVAPGQSTAANIAITFNGDTGSNYTFTSNLGYLPVTSSVWKPLVSFDAANITLTNQSAGVDATSTKAVLILNETNTTNAKTFTAISYKDTGSSATSYPGTVGTYFGSAAITSVTLTLSAGTFTASGTVALYGVAA